MRSESYGLVNAIKEMSRPVMCRCVSMNAIDLTDLLASGQARRINEHTVEIVTPGYHADSVIFDECAPFSVVDWEKLRRSQRLRELRGDWLETEMPDYHNDPQGDAMSLYGCDNPGCVQCHPLTASETVKNRAGSLPSWNTEVYIDWSWDLARKEMANEIANAFKLSPQDLGLPMKNKEQSMSTSAKQVINGLRELDESELPYISREIDTIKRQNKERIVKGLDGVVDLETLKSPDVRSFAIAYYQNGEVRIAKGVEFGDTVLIGEKDTETMHRVYVQGRDYPACGPHYTMPVLRKKLEDNNIVYRIAYYSED